MKRFGLVALTIGMIAACSSEDSFSSNEPQWPASGAPPLETPEQEDRVVQVQIPKVDILFVVDNSCSMETSQTRMAANFPFFINYFLGSGLDYHIGVVSTDVESSSSAGVLIERGGHQYLDDSTPNAEGVFTTMVNLGTSGHFDERGRRAAYTALEMKADTDNAGFLRDEAALHIVFVSDENDYSNNLPPKDEFIEWMRTKKWAEDMVTAHAITGARPAGCAVETGQDYIDYALSTNGVLWDICSDDWAGFMDELGLAASGLKREYFLSEVPVEDTIDVRVETGEGVTLDFVVGGDVIYNPTRNSIVFEEFVPNPFDEVYVKYQVLAAYADGSVEEDVND